MRILVACERSQRVCAELRALGHEAWSCDVAPTQGDAQWHLRCDCREVLERGWDMIIAFPPCTHLSAAGARYWSQKQDVQREAIDFVRAIADCSCPRVAIENPVGVLSTAWRKPDQLIQPWQFGDAYVKKTCLWLKGLPTLKPTNVVEPVAYWCSSSYRGGPRKDGSRRVNPLHNANPYGGRTPTTQRDITFPGIAHAMATQWTSSAPSSAP